MADQSNEGLLSPFLRKQRLEAARPHIKGRVLDVGCGSGAVADLVAADRYVGVDVDELSLDNARKFHPQHIFQSCLPPPESGFDTIVSLAVIEHIKEPVGYLHSLADRLATESTSCIVLTTPHPAIDWVHTAGAYLGLFSRHAQEEHDDLFNKSQLEGLARKCGLSLVIYRRFLFGANQLAVFQKDHI